MAKAATKTRVTKKQITAHREKASRDPSPKWEGCESWTAEQFTNHFRNAMNYYRLEADSKFAKPAVIQWMERVGCTKSDIQAFKKTKDFRCGVTMGAVAHCLTRGMTPQRADFNNGRDSSEWLREQIILVISSGKDDIEAEEKKEEKPAGIVINIQDRLRESSLKMTEEIEDALQEFNTDPNSFDPKTFKVLNLLKGKQAKAAHARIIKNFYEPQMQEIEEAIAGKDEQLKEGYSHRSKAQLKKLSAFLHEVVSVCDMLGQEAKVNRKPRAKKPTDKAKVVSKLKYMKAHEPLKLVSVNPIDIIGSKELWVYNTKTRKIGKYVATEFQELGIKGTSITGFNETLSVQKTLRKPEEKLKEFKNAGKVALRKFIEDINAVDIKLNGRISEDVILLKVS
jgi:hypothetical protein